MRSSRGSDLPARETKIGAHIKEDAKPAADSSKVSTASAAATANTENARGCLRPSDDSEHLSTASQPITHQAVQSVTACCHPNAKRSLDLRSSSRDVEHYLAPI